MLARLQTWSLGTWTPFKARSTACRLPAGLPSPALPDIVRSAFCLWLPETLRGPELSPLEFMAVVEAASALDGSMGGRCYESEHLCRCRTHRPWTRSRHNASLKKELFRAYLCAATARVSQIPQGVTTHRSSS